MTDSRITISRCIVVQRIGALRGVEIAVGVARDRIKTIGNIAVSGRIGGQR